MSQFILSLFEIYKTIPLIQTSVIKSMKIKIIMDDFVN